MLPPETQFSKLVRRRWFVVSAIRGKVSRIYTLLRIVSTVISYFETTCDGISG